MDLAAIVADIKTNLEHFNVLHQTADAAIQAKEAARVALVKLLRDAHNAIGQLIDELGPVPGDAAPPAPQVAPPAPGETPTPQVAPPPA